MNYHKTCDAVTTHVFSTQHKGTVEGVAQLENMLDVITTINMSHVFVCFLFQMCLL